jgi:hypothetical protein
MEFTSPGEPHQWWAPSAAELLAQFGQRVTMLTDRPPGGAAVLVSDFYWGAGTAT